MSIIRFLFVLYISFSCLSTLASSSKLNSLDDLKRFVNTNGINSVEQLLEKLPLSLRKRYHLLHKTRGLGFASARLPRVLISTQKSKLVLTFGTDESHESYNIIEAMDFDPKEKNFNFQEINFNNSSSKFSKLNPSKCMKCHYSKALDKRRPVWDHSQIWEGFYGAYSDEVYALLQSKDLGPGWKVKYFAGEGITYDKYIYPRLEKDSIFKYLPRDIYSKETGYLFRTPAESPLAKNLELLTSRSNMDSYLKHLKSKGLDARKYIYPLLASSSCLTPGGWSTEGDKLDELAIKILGKSSYSQMAKKLAGKLGFVYETNLKLAKDFVHFFKETNAKLRTSKNNRACKQQNNILKDLGEDKRVNCNRPFDTFVPSRPDYAEIFNTFDQFISSYNISAEYIYHLVFNSTGFAYEDWSASGEKWRSWTTTNQDGRNITWPLINNKTIRKDYFAMYLYAKLRLKKQTRDLTPWFYMEIKNFPVNFTEGDNFAQVFCKKIVEKSLKFNK